MYAGAFGRVESKDAGRQTARGLAVEVGVRQLGVEDALGTLTPRIIDEIASLSMAGTGRL